MHAAAGSPVLVVGALFPASRSVLREVLRDRALHIEHIEPVAQALDWLNDAEPCAVVIDSDQEQSRQVATGIRAQPRYSHIPILCLRSRIDDLAFLDMFRWGGDDLVTNAAAWQLLARLRALARLPQGPRSGHELGTVLIGDTDRARRVALSRILHNAGYDVSYVADADDLHDEARERAPAIIVTSMDVTPDPAQDIRACRREGVRSRWVLLSPPRSIQDARALVRGLPSVVVVDGFAPPENVLFLLNELKNPVGKSRRASKRLLHASLVAFRGAGRDADDFGFSFNVSEGGIYVRTLAPPTDDFVWLELSPPRSERRVRLVGKIAWRRPFGPNEGATVPPGFGVQIVDLARVDVDWWTECYGTFSGDVG